LKETSYIEFTVGTSPLGVRELVNCEWKGKSPYVRVSLWFRDAEHIKQIDGDKEIQIGPYRLLKVEDAHFIEWALYVRKDKFGALRVALYKSTRLLDLIYRRLIITLAVWKLADFREATVPSWRDVKIVKKLLHG
jgi:hypothetical protein